MWNQGIDTWWRFLDTTHIKGLSSRRKIGYDFLLRKAIDALECGQANYFSQLLPPHCSWRLWPHFEDEACFLDIETTGYYGDVTVVGLYGEHGVNTLVRGKNLSKDTFLTAIKPYKLLVTFNGASFDLPVLSRYFKINFEQPHIDLRSVCNQLGLAGGLKKIESTIGLHRPKEVQGMDGYQAVLLWDQYIKTNDDRYLELLVEYNTQDIVNLKPLAMYAIPRLWKKVRTSFFEKNRGSTCTAF